MNLADIRKKAQQEKVGAPEELQADQTAISAFSPVEEEPEAFTPAEVPEQEFEHMLPAVRPGAVVPSFDPLAVLLAGRARAGCEEETAVEETAREGASVQEFQEFLCFRVSDELYAISIMEIKEIIKPREVTEVPRVPSFISGVLSLRGIIIPVFNMHERLGLSGSQHTGKERIIVVKKGEDFAGVFVDEVIQVVKIAEGTIEQPPAVLEGIDREFVSGIGRFDGKMLILLKLQNILDLTLC